MGAGPAGWAVAAACADIGLAVGLVADDPSARWHQTYGAWSDELATVGMTDVAARRWETALVRTDGDLRALGRTYCLIDNDGLRSTLMARAGRITRTAGRAVAVATQGRTAVLTLADGTRLTGRAVVDATGFPPALGPATAAGRAYQTAYGLIGEFARPPATPGAMCLMDFDATPFAEPDPPTFLYAMDLGDGRWLVEETSLAQRPGLRLAVLRDRLSRRLDARGAMPVRVDATERVAFVMDAPLPPPGPAVAFGAAAAMVHPATGYHVAYALRRAPEVAAALAAALDVPGATTDAVAAAATRAVWPPDLRRQHALYRLGLEVLMSFDAVTTRGFFDAFFSLPPAHWQRYLSRTASTTQLQATMLRMMTGLSPDLRRRLLGAVAAPASRRWVRAALPAPLTR